MAVPVNNTAAVYYPPRGEPLFGIEGLVPLNCTIVSVGPTGDMVCAFVRSDGTTGPYTAWVAENVPYCDGDSEAADVPPCGGYVAPVGFTIPEPVAVTPPEQTVYINPDVGPIFISQNLGA